MHLDSFSIVILIVAAVMLGVSLVSRDWLWATFAVLTIVAYLLHARRNRS